MKTLCFALILNATTPETNVPPSHVQDLLKKRILFQLKQQNQDLQFYFDEATCNVIGTYDYTGDSLKISTYDKNVELHLPYNDVIEGKKLDLSGLSTSIDNKTNIIAAATTQNLFDRNSQESAKENETSGKSTFKKVLPWVVGAVVLSLGGWAVYNSIDDDNDRGGAAPPARRRR